MSAPPKPLVVYAGPFAFPDGGAAARRVLGNALALIAAGFDVEVWTAQKPRPGAATHVHGIRVRALGERHSENLPRLFKHLAYLAIGRGLIRALDSDPRPIAAVILYSGYSPYLLRLTAWSRRTKTPIAFDAVEWYDPPHPLRWLVDPYYWNTEFAMRRLAQRAGNAIAISRHLETHFSRYGCCTVRIPPTLDVTEVDADVDDRGSGEPILLCYAGSPGHKDRLGALIVALARFDADGRAIRLVVAGVDAPALLALADVRAHGLKSLPACVSALGKVTHAQAIALTRAADFSVLLRPTARFAKAGFPTKVVESLAAGTPVFANLTGDLSLHLRDGQNAIIVGSIGVEAVLAGLKRLVALPRGAFAAMRRAARCEAERAFDYRIYVPALSGFIANLAAATPDRMRRTTCTLP